MSGEKNTLTMGGMPTVSVPRERAQQIIDHCVDTSYREMLGDYFRAACRRGGHTPHLLEEAFAWHLRQQRTGSMCTQDADAWV